MYWVSWTHLVLQAYTGVVRYFSVVRVAFSVKGLDVVLRLELGRELLRSNFDFIQISYFHLFGNYLND